jgi:protein AATF/BFR2
MRKLGKSFILREKFYFLTICNRKSKLRKSEEVSLGPQYSGSRISREALLNNDDEEEGEESDEEEDTKFADPEDVDFDMDEDDGEIDSDEVLGESDMEKFKEFTFRGSGKPRDANGSKKRPTAADFMPDSDDEGAQLNGDASDEIETDEDILDVDAQHPEDSENEEGESAEDAEDQSDDESAPDEEAESGDESDNGSEEEGDEKARRAELRKIMNEEQKTVVATISQAAKADADKGGAVKQQRKAFDSLLSVRMVLQKALVATNSMAATDEKDSEEAASQPYEAAEEAAIKLWNTLDGLRHELSKASTGAKTGQKRKRGIDILTPSSTIWERMQASEISMMDNRQTTLVKWSAKVRGATALPLFRKLNPTAPQQSIISILQVQLASSEHLARRTKIPRSCAPIQRDLKVTEDPNIYDDGNFYQLLLKELVDQRRVESLSAPAAGAEAGKTWMAVKEAKTKKNVDTKASKGRKMRFTVHEKLQNFMAPEDRGRWEPEAIDRFFGTLLGQKMTLGEEDDGLPLEEQGLMLFRS